MKEINSKLYGYTSELKVATSADDLTEFRAVDTGALYIAFNGIWYEQPTPFAVIDAIADVAASSAAPEQTADPDLLSALGAISDAISASDDGIET